MKFSRYYILGTLLLDCKNQAKNLNQNSSRIANLLTGTKYSTQTANYPPTNITAKDNNSPKAGLLVEIVY